jgi:DNA-binding response OmpR family regulator
MDNTSGICRKLCSIGDWGMSGRILICGDEPSLLETRYMVLDRAGFAVVSTCSREELASLPQEPAFRLAVIGRMLTEEDKKSIVEEIRRRWSGIRILFLTSQRDSLQQISSNEYISNSLPPREFVTNCRQILEG